MRLDSDKWYQKIYVNFLGGKLQGEPGNKASLLCVGKKGLSEGV